VLRSRKHRYGKNPAVPVPGTSWVRILPGYRCMCTPGVPVFSQKKKFPVRFWYGSGRVGSGTGPVRGEAKTASFRLKTEASQPLDSILIFSANQFSLLCSLSLTSSTVGELGSLSSALCLSLPPPPVSSVPSPLLSVSHFLHRR
jgi:hypothetical protein